MPTKPMHCHPNTHTNPSGLRAGHDGLDLVLRILPKRRST
jgi:hypothetical protein